MASLLGTVFKTSALVAHVAVVTFQIMLAGLLWLIKFALSVSVEVATFPITRFMGRRAGEGLKTFVSNLLFAPVCVGALLAHTAAFVVLLIGRVFDTFGHMILGGKQMDLKQPFGGNFGPGFCGPAEQAFATFQMNLAVRRR